MQTDALEFGQSGVPSGGFQALIESDIFIKHCDFCGHTYPIFVHINLTLARFRFNY